MLQEIAHARSGPSPAGAYADVSWPATPTAVEPTMRAMAFDRFGPPEVLEARQLPTPVPGPDEVLVRVAAVGVGRLLDLTARAGTHHYQGFQLPHVLGAEHSGTAVAVGSGVTSVKVGDHVAVFPVITCGDCQACRSGRTEGCSALEILGIHRPGAYAEYTRVPAANVHVVPPGIDPVGAAALALAGPVAMNQFDQAGLVAGDWLLVQGAASALGSLTAALGVHLGARVIGTSRSAHKRDILKTYGLTAVLDPTADDFVAQVLNLTDNRGVAVAVDDLGEPRIWSGTLAALATLGTAVSSGTFLGGQVELDLKRLYLRSQRIIGVRTGTPSSTHVLWEEVRRGFRPVVDRSFPLSQAPQAHRYLQDDSNTGRVVLVVDGAGPTAGATDDSGSGPDAGQAR